MKENQGYEQDLASISRLMERSVRFISLNGLSGVLSGLYALMGAAGAYYLLQYPGPILENRVYHVNDYGLLLKLIGIALVVLCSSLATGLWLSARKAKRMGAKVWDSTSKRLLINLAIPLITGALFVLICLSHNDFEWVGSACLIFYGMALLQASPNLYEEVRYLAYSEIILGLTAAALPGYSLIIWAFGFGILHIVYGTMMHLKYDR